LCAVGRAQSRSRRFRHGHSSLSYLQKFCFDADQDRSLFIASTAGDDVNANAGAHRIIFWGANWAFTVIAEESNPGAKELDCRRKRLPL